MSSGPARSGGWGCSRCRNPAPRSRSSRVALPGLGMTGGMLSGTGIKGNLGSKEYWPIYAEAERLGCPLAVHAGNHVNFGMDQMNVFAPAHAIGHPLAMMIGLGGLVFNGVFDRFPRPENRVPRRRRRLAAVLYRALRVLARQLRPARLAGRAAQASRRAVGRRLHTRPDRARPDFRRRRGRRIHACRSD